MSNLKIAVPVLWDNDGNFRGNTMYSIDIEAQVVNVVARPIEVFPPNTKPVFTDTLAVNTEQFGLLYLNLTLAEYQNLIRVAESGSGGVPSEGIAIGDPVSGASGGGLLYADSSNNLAQTDTPTIKSLHIDNQPGPSVLQLGSTSNNITANGTAVAINVSGSLGLPSNTTGTTQSPGDNSTKIATTAYVNAATGTPVTSVSGTANQIASTGGTTPVISIVTNPVLPGSPTIAAPGNSTQNIVTTDATQTLSNKTLTAAVLGSSTATTQSAGDNSTKVATTAYVDAGKGTFNAVGNGSTVTFTATVPTGYTTAIVWIISGALTAPSRNFVAYSLQNMSVSGTTLSVDILELVQTTAATAKPAPLATTLATTLVLGYKLIP